MVTKRNNRDVGIEMNRILGCLAAIGVYINLKD